MDDLFQIFSLDNEQFPSVVYRRGGDLSPGGQPGSRETASCLSLRVGQGEGGGGEDGDLQESRRPELLSGPGRPVHFRHGPVVRRPQGRLQAAGGQQSHRAGRHQPDAGDEGDQAAGRPDQALHGPRRDVQRCEASPQAVRGGGSVRETRGGGDGAQLQVVSQD